MDLTGLTIDNIQNFISNLGFPIFMCLYFMYSQRRAENRHDKVIDKIECVESALQETKLQVGEVLPAAAHTLAQAEANQPQNEEVKK